MWKLRDIVVTVILSVVCGAIYMGWDWLATVTGGASPWLLGLMNGVWWIASVLVAYIVRRPGAAFLGGAVSALFEWAFGSPYGAGALISGLVQGGGAEVGLLLFGWKRYSTSVLMFAGAFGGVGNIIQWYFQYGGGQYSLVNQIGYIITTLISGAILGGLLPKWIDDALYRTGALRNFEIGKQKRALSK